MSEFIRYNVEDAGGESRKLLEDIQGAYGFIPELFRYMAESPVAIKAYMQLNSLLEESSLNPKQVQIALLAASVSNQCEFCKTAHHAMARQTGVDEQTIDALKSGGRIENEQDRALAELTQAIVNDRGWIADEVLQRFLEAGHSREQVYEVIVAVAMKTLSNYSNHLTQPEPNPELEAMLK